MTDMTEEDRLEEESRMYDFWIGCGLPKEYARTLQRAFRGCSTYDLLHMHPIVIDFFRKRANVDDRICAAADDSLQKMHNTRHKPPIPLRDLANARLKNKGSETENQESRQKMIDFWIKHDFAPNVAQSLERCFAGMKVAELLKMSDNDILNSLNNLDENRETCQKAYKVVLRARDNVRNRRSHFSEIGIKSSVLNPYCI